MNGKETENRFWHRFFRDPYIWFVFGWVVTVLTVSFTLIKSAWRYFGIFIAVVSVACDVLPIPTNPVVIGTVQLLEKYFKPTGIANFFHTYLALPRGPLLESLADLTVPVSVALIATLGMVMANMLEYQVFSKLTRTRAIIKLKEARIYISWVKLFKKAPPVALALTAFVPIPIDFIRIIAILEGYSRLKLSVFQFLGRLPRNILLVVIGMSLPFWTVFPLAFILLIPGFIYGWWDNYRQKKGIDVEWEKENVFEKVLDEIEVDEHIEEE